MLSRKRKRYSLKILSWRGYNASREWGDLFSPLNGCPRRGFIVWECNWGSAIGEVPSCCKHLQFEKCGKTPTVIKPMFDQTGFGHTREIGMGVLGPPYLHWPCNFGKSFLKLFLDFEGYFSIIWLLKIGQVWTSASMSVQFRLELNLGQMVSNCFKTTRSLFGSCYWASRRLSTWFDLHKWVKVGPNFPCSTNQVLGYFALDLDPNGLHLL